MTWISWVGMYSSTNFFPCNRYHKVLFPVFLSPRMTIFTGVRKKLKPSWQWFSEEDMFALHTWNKHTPHAFLTVILDPLGEAPLQTLVHWLQSSRDSFLPELPRLRSYQLFQCRKHFEASQAGVAARSKLHLTISHLKMNTDITAVFPDGKITKSPWFKVNMRPNYLILTGFKFS